MSKYQVTAKELSAQRAAVLRDIIASYSKVGRLFKELRETLQEAGIVPAGPQLAIYFDKEYTPRDADVAVAVPVDSGASLPEDGRVVIGELPGGLFVSLVRVGPWDDFRPAYQAIMDWVKESDYEIAGPNREIHLKGPGSGAPPEEYEIEIQFPIQKKS